MTNNFWLNNFGFHSYKPQLPVLYSCLFKNFKKNVANSKNVFWFSSRKDEIYSVLKFIKPYK